MILVLRTDTDRATIKLMNFDGERLSDDQWTSGRKLSGELLNRIKQALAKSEATWSDLTGIIVYLGPGSFTGLRIGAAVANTIAYAQEVPIVGTRGEMWLSRGLQRLKQGENDKQVIPYYGAEANITRPNASA